MTALDDRRAWLIHLRECTLCPVNLCDKGMELAAAVQETLTPGESWQGVWSPQLPGFRRQLGQELRRIRQEKGLRLADVSAISHVSTGHLSDVERGESEASSELLNAICEALEVFLSVSLQRRKMQLDR